MDAASRPRPPTGMSRDAARAIARAFLPARAWGNRYDYHYTQAKLRTDPLYPRVIGELRGGSLPLLDLGCGLGLLAHALRADGQDGAYLGLDVDAAKISRANRAAGQAGLADVRFAVAELGGAPLPPHAGAVALLDVLHYLPATEQLALLAQAATRLAATAPLVIRTPLAGDDPRGRLTRLTDRVGHLSGWMRTAPRDYPSRDDLLAALADQGLQASCTPLFGNTPFNNWLLVARRH